MRTFHLPLPDDLHEALRAEACNESKPATVIVREALETLLEARRRDRLADEIRAYAESVAGTDLDLDGELETAAVESLLSGEPSP